MVDEHPRLLILYLWAREYPVSDAVEEAEISSRVAVDIYQWLCEVCTAKLLQTQIILGGPGVVIQIDESLFRHKPKVHTRRLETSVIIKLIASYPGSRLLKCVDEEESLVSTALWFKLDPRHSSGSAFTDTLSHHARIDDIISCQVSIKSYCSFLMAIASSKSIM